jgi:hypothetical protein
MQDFLHVLIVAILSFGSLYLAYKLPKKSEFDKISKTEIIHIQNCLNNRPRKVLQYKTPNDVDSH